MNKMFDFKDISLVPEIISSINSRSEIVPYTENITLPIMVSPMDTVLDIYNFDKFLDAGLVICMPRSTPMIEYNNLFNSISLDQFGTLIDNFDKLPNEYKVLVDIANGHMSKLYELTKRFCELRTEHNTQQVLMVGNIANPLTYVEFAKLGVDYIRVGIGGGSACTTSANGGVHYPMASLIDECYKYKKHYGYTTKIVADGGFRNYDDIIKALALGADYVMLGGLMNKCLESCSRTKLFNKIPLSYTQASFIWDKIPRLRKHLYKNYRGMSTKEVQKSWGRKKLKTAEGISKSNNVEYKLNQWVDNFVDYLKSTMSYTNSLTLQEFKNSQYIFITQNALKRYEK